MKTNRVSKELYHVPVMVEEILEEIGNSAFKDVIIDCTCGTGGHAEAILSRYGEEIKQYICIDRDRVSLELAQERLERWKKKMQFYHMPYDRIGEIVIKTGSPDFLLYDLGLSMWQIKFSDRGFSFKNDEILDMRFDPTEGEPLYIKLRRIEPARLENILKLYGEVKAFKKVAYAIVKHRKEGLKTTGELVKVLKSLRLSEKEIQKIFMALRIWVNEELKHLIRGITKGVQVLNISGKMAVLTYHSIEDRIIKQLRFFKNLEFRSLIYPSEEEVRGNPASRSAKLRVFLKTGPVKDEEILHFYSLLNRFLID